MADWSMYIHTIHRVIYEAYFDVFHPCDSADAKQRVIISKNKIYISIQYQTIPNADIAQSPMYIVLNAKFTRNIRDILFVLFRVK